MGDVTYRHDFGGLRELAVGAEMHLMLIEKAIEAKAYAISISPDAPPYGEGYISSFEVDAGHTERVAGLKRAMAYLRNMSDHAVYVEYGNGHGTTGVPPYRDGFHVLGRTADWLEKS